MFKVGDDLGFNSCLTTKIEVRKQRHRWVIDNIWFPTAHLCPVGPEFLTPVPRSSALTTVGEIWAPH